MFLSHVMRKYLSKETCSHPIVALDLCAAPGGKSTLTLSELPKDSLLITNEVVKQRANILAENLMKWGNPNIIVTNNYAEDFQSLGAVFDLIICDVPCSGEGMFRKDQQSISEWSPQNVETCWKRQRYIIQQIWPCLKPNGILIYSTCTYNTMEDEENVLDCGIEIRVQPPGKAVSAISLLSGGEKAFVAIALYFAILKVRPTPFCVMDEIEAALDEANVSRFAGYMRNLSKSTQFLVITHRRGTMEEADHLFGVTMQEKGVSRVIGLSLDEAAKSIR